MKLLLMLSLTCTLLNTAESLRCNMCSNQDCSNSTSVTCPVFSMCRTVTSLKRVGMFPSVIVNKNCSPLLSCITPLNTETEWSVNQGFVKEAHRQLCCITNDCNFRTLDIPNSTTNAKQCPGCSSTAQSLDGTCNGTASCEGVEQRCFTGSTTLNSTQFALQGCISNNLCSIPDIFGTHLAGNFQITCGAPCSVRMSAMLLTFAVTAHKVLL